ncbi:STAS domain-containing protein [Candidatus Peregrinibacteria bacterium]|nr:STAS domain-containing protein [Candidatus Peregrinibacteria bacterium]
MSNFNITSLSHKIADKKVRVIKIMGSLDACNIPHVEEALHSYIEEGIGHLVVNLKKLEYISSGGIGTLVKFAKELKSKKGSLKIVELPKKIQGVLNTLGIATILDTHNTAKEAFLSIQKGR